MVYDVLISGAGPAGIMAANLLGKAGMKVAIFDKRDTIFPLPRAAVIDDDIARIFQHAGLENPLKEITSVSKGYQFLNQADEVMFGFVRDHQPSVHGYATSFCIRQPEVEHILRQGVARYDNVELFMGHEVVRVEQNEEEATLTVKQNHSETLQTFKGQYVIAAEGARSTIRKQLNGTLENLNFDHPWLIVDFEVTGDTTLQKSNLQYCQPDRPVTFLYLGRNLYRFEIMLKPDEEIAHYESEENVLQLMSELMNVDGVKIERFVTYTFHALIAEKWQIGRTFLVGDTAHQMPPFLGQGLSSGIRDAANIAWKLIAVIQNGANESLLQTYHEERHPHVYKIMQQAIILGSIIQAPSKELATFRDNIFKYLNSVPNVKEALQNIERSKSPVGKGFHHESLQQPHCLYAPQFSVGENRLDELINRQFSLVVHPQVNRAELQRKYPTLQVISLEVTEPVLQWFDEYNATIALVRPDAYVYAFATETTIEQIVEDVQKIMPIEIKRGVRL